MRAAPPALLLGLALSGCFGADLGACEQRPGSVGDEVRVRVVWNATAPAEPVEGACVQAYPTDAGGRTDELSRQVRVDGGGKAALRLEEAYTWRLFARVAAPEDKACGHTSQTIELRPPAAEELVLLVDRSQRVCA